MNNELKSIIAADRSRYQCFSSKKAYMKELLFNGRDLNTFKYIKLMRKEEYLQQKILSGASGGGYRLLHIMTKRKRVKLGRYLGLDIGVNSFAPGLYIAHTQIIVGSCHIGKNATMHGQNCIGSGAVIGDNVELMVGAKVFGPSHLANDITVAAGAIVVSSFGEEGITIAGVPARKIDRKEGADKT